MVGIIILCFCACAVLASTSNYTRPSNINNYKYYYHKQGYNIYSYSPLGHPFLFVKIHWLGKGDGLSRFRRSPPAQPTNEIKKSLRPRRLTLSPTIVWGTKYGHHTRLMNVKPVKQFGRKLVSRPFQHLLSHFANKFNPRIGPLW